MIYSTTINITSSKIISSQDFSGRNKGWKEGTTKTLVLMKAPFVDKILVVGFLRLRRINPTYEN